MAAAARGQERGLPRFVYVTRFGSHRCGGVVRLGGRRAQGRGNPGRRAACSPEEPRAAAPDGAELAPGPRPREPAVSSPARASSAQSGTSSAARAGGAGRAGRRLGVGGGRLRPRPPVSGPSAFPPGGGGRWGPAGGARGAEGHGLEPLRLPPRGAEAASSSPR